jgi:hypothetical protein
MLVAQNNMKALYDMFMKSWAIMGFDGFIICFKHNIIGEGSTIYFSMYGV